MCGWELPRNRSAILFEEESTMAKKKSRASQTSKGKTHQNPKRLGHKMEKQKRLEYTSTFLQGSNKRAAWARGRRVMLTVPNPNPNETNKPFIRVNASEVWGDWRGKKAPK